MKLEEVHQKPKRIPNLVPAQVPMRRPEAQKPGEKLCVAHGFVLLPCRRSALVPLRAHAACFQPCIGRSPSGSSATLASLGNIAASPFGQSVSSQAAHFPRGFILCDMIWFLFPFIPAQCALFPFCLTPFLWACPRFLLDVCYL